MSERPKKRDYECRSCGYILEDEEIDENGGICNRCLISGEDEGGRYDWEDYK